MRRIVLAGIAALTILGAVGFSAYWLLGTCRPLDRLLGVSGCTEVVRIAAFDPLRSVALTAPDASGTSSFFGHARTADGWRPAMVRLDLYAGQEVSRHPVRALNGFGWMVLANDGERAMFTCAIQSICTEDGRRAAILSLADAAILETLESDTGYVVHFPGDPVPDGEDAFRAVFAANGERVVEVTRDSGMILFDSAGAEIATLIDNPTRNLSAADISVSPSGARVALFESSRSGSSARLRVWDAQTGAPVLDRELDSTYRWGINPAWTRDETRLTLIRRDGPDTLIELHRALP